MKADLRDKYFGHTIDEWIAKIPGELSIDAVGLWQIVSFGRQGFDLDGSDLDGFVRRAVHALLEKGARPVLGATDDIHYWIPLNLGETPHGIANAIISEWRRTGKDPDAGGIWFALPHIYGAVRRDNSPGHLKSCLS